MKRTPLVAGNWKLNKTSAETRDLLAALLPGLAGIDGVEKLVCPPFTALSAAHDLLRGTSVALGAQDIYWEDKGAFTGEVSGPMLREFCTHVIIGHSERRAYFNETDQTVNRKTAAALAHGLIPVVCVGETLDENEAGRAAEVVSRQVRDGLGGLKVGGAAALVIAYEPVWAIGTGKAAQPEDATRIIRNVIRPTLAGLFGEDVAQGVRVLYGGSVNGANAADYFGEPEVDGALVGGASLKPDDFIAITRAAA
ncbi:MAG: triose-phosphate isomerase [Anaerolineae bacterium]|nr:MAG: triose-phosphate isomerase [Anaerolineae bacterium]